MNISFHAAERLLQRAFGLTEYGKQEIYRAKLLLEQETKNMVILGKKRIVALPSFESIRAVYLDNTIVTVIPATSIKE